MGVYTYDDALCAVRQCKHDLGEFPSAEAYSRWVVGKNFPSKRLLLQILAEGLGDKAIKVRTKRKLRPKVDACPSPSKNAGRQAASWSTTLIALGEEPDAIERRRKESIAQYSVQDCTDALKRCETALGRVPTTTDYETWHQEQRRAGLKFPSCLSLTRICANGRNHFSWVATLECCGLDTAKFSEQPRKVSEVIHRSDELLIEVVQTCAGQIGDVPSTYSYAAWRSAPQNREHLYPTDTTLRRRIADGGTWDEVLIAAELDPKKKSAAKNSAFASAQTAICVASLERLVAQFNGLPPSSIYIRWSQMVPGTPSYGALMYWLGGAELAWETAVKNAGLDSVSKISVQLAEARHGVLPSLPKPNRCLQAIEDFRSEKQRFPTLSAYRAWSSNGCPVGTPNAAQILGVLAPRTWDWADVRSLCT